MDNKQEYHVGEEIQKVFKDSGMTRKAFADKIGCAVSNINNIFTRKEISMPLLKNISDVLKHDFVMEYLECLGIFMPARLVEERPNKLIPAEKREQFNKVVSCNTKRLPYMKSEKEFCDFIEAYIQSDQWKMLIVAAYNCPNSTRSIIRKMAYKAYNLDGYKEVQDIKTMKSTNYKVYVFSQLAATLRGEDPDVFLSEIAEANLHTKKRIIVIIDIPKRQLEFIREYYAMARYLRWLASRWWKKAIVVGFDKSGALNKAREDFGRAFIKKKKEDATQAVKSLSPEEEERIKTCTDDLVYSEDGKKLLKVKSNKELIEVKPGVKQVCNEAFKGLTNLKKVILPESLLSIGEQAFAECPELLQIVIPPAVFSIKWGCFKGCEKLTYVELSSKLLIIRESAFEGCKSLKHISIPDSVRRIERRAFADTGLEHLILRREVYNKCIFPDEVFCDCQQLRTLEFDSSFIFQLPTNFMGCENLKEVTIIGKHINEGHFIEGLTGLCPSLETITYKLK